MVESTPSGSPVCTSVGFSGIGDKARNASEVASNSALPVSFTGRPKEIIQPQHHEIESYEQSPFHNGAEVEIGHDQRCAPWEPDRLNRRNPFAQRA